MPTKRERIITARSNRLAAIQPANGDVTGAGQRVNKGPATCRDNVGHV